MARRLLTIRQTKAATTTPKRRQTPLAWVVSVRVGGLAIILLLGEVLFLVVSMKASHEMMTTTSSKRIHSLRSDTTSTFTGIAPRSLRDAKSLMSRHSTPSGQELVLPVATTTTAALVSDQVMEMCSRTLWHTVETTTIVLPNNETFIHTGDIDDLWLRDSAAQVHPLLLPLLEPSSRRTPPPTAAVVVVPTIVDQNNNNHPAKKVALIYDDPKLDRIVSGLIARHATYIRHDPYANAFRIDDSYVFSAAQKQMGRHDLISTWNYELDSGCYYIRLLYYYWQASRDPIVLTRNPAVQEAVSIMVDVWIAEQRHEEDVYPTGSLFDCQNCQRPYRYPGLARDGKGRPTNASSGLTWSAFRPSDDECKYGFLIPANMFAVTVLDYAQQMALELWHNLALAEKAKQLQTDLVQGLRQHGTVQHPQYGTIYAYEVDGLGNSLLMDDANVPSLLSLPYLQYPYLDQDIYANTKRFLFSKDNPTFASGTNALTGFISGIGSPHMKGRIRNNIWPMSLAMEGIITKDVRIAEQLVQASAGTGWMHESFDASDPHRFTRSWFCWADALFAELALTLLNETNSVHLCLERHQYHVLEWRDNNNNLAALAGGRFAKS